MIPEVESTSLREQVEGSNPPRLLDVREDDELAVSHLPDVVHVPLMRLPSRLDELDREADWVVVCRSGARSAQATAFLKGQGFARVRNLAGGMKGYAQAVDPSMVVA